MVVTDKWASLLRLFRRNVFFSCCCFCCYLKLSGRSEFGPCPAGDYHEKGNKNGRKKEEGGGLGRDEKEEGRTADDDSGKIDSRPSLLLVLPFHSTPVVVVPLVHCHYKVF